MEQKQTTEFESTVAALCRLHSQWQLRLSVHPEEGPSLAEFLRDSDDPDAVELVRRMSLSRALTDEQGITLLAMAEAWYSRLFDSHRRGGLLLEEFLQEVRDIDDVLGAVVALDTSVGRAKFAFQATEDLEDWRAAETLHGIRQGSSQIDELAGGIMFTSLDNEWNQAVLRGFDSPEERRATFEAQNRLRTLMQLPPLDASEASDKLD